MLKLTDVSKRFQKQVAVENLSLGVERGEVFGLLGPNGAGKSTTIHMAVGLLIPDGGTVELEGAGSPTDEAVRSKIGVAPQVLSLYEDLSGEENLTFFGRLFGLRGAGLATRVGEMLEFAGLTGRRKDRVSKYSGGMKRRLNLAVALISKPPLLLLDEPTVGVDPQSRNAIFDSILELKSQGLTVVYTTHYMEEAERLCDRVGIMDCGKLLALDTVDRLIGQHGGKDVITVQRSNGEEKLETSDPIRDLTRILGEGDLHGVKIDRPDLETVFLNLTGRSLRD